MSRVHLEAPVDRVAGERLPPTVPLGAFVRDPNDDEVLGAQMASAAPIVDRAIATAAEAHARGVLDDIPQRIALLERIAQALESRQEAMAIADAATTGVVVSLTRKLAGIPLHAFRGAAAALRDGALLTTLPGAHGPVEVRREAWGPAAVIAPWNAPAAIAAHKVASALAAGCPVVLKPSEWAPHSCNRIADAIEEAGAPRGAFQLVHGGAEVGAQLTGDRRIAAVSFTGGLAGGRAVAAACARDLKPVQLELGGNNALVVLDDADVEAASRGIVTGLTTLNGQWCRAVGRIFVHSTRSADLLARTLARLEAVTLGSSLSAESTMGPLVHRAHLDRVRAQIDALVRRGGTAHATTRLPGLSGCFLAPTIVTGCTAKDAEDEIFGPVATLHAFDDDAEAIALANDSPFGLAAYVYGSDTTRALAVARRLRAGSIKVNGVSLLSLHPAAPRPAWGLSGVGDEGTLESLHFFCGTRVVGVAEGPAS